MRDLEKLSKRLRMLRYRYVPNIRLIEINCIQGTKGAGHLGHSYIFPVGFHVPNNEFFRQLAWTLWVPIRFTTASFVDLG